MNATLHAERDATHRVIPDFARGLGAGVEHRCACPQCARGGMDDALAVKVDDDGRGGTFYCHRCEYSGNWHEPINGTRRPAARTRRTSGPEDHRALWESGAEPGEACEHPYLIGKQIGTHGVRILGDALLVPVRDVAGELHGVQKIDASDTKRYTRGARPAGAFHLIGTPATKVIIAEGYATAASIFEATGEAVAVAFNCNNLAPVARQLHQEHPALQIVIAADDDYQTAGNPGLTAGTAAAHAVNGLVAIPDFGVHRPDAATDFNDLARQHGPEAVQACIAKAKRPQATANTAIRPAYIVHESTSTALLACNYAIKGIADLQTIVLIYGASNSGKTFFVLDMTLHVGHGMRWRGRRTRKCLVLYIAAEAGIALQRRIRAWLDHHQVAAEDGAFWIRQRGISLIDPETPDQIAAELATIDNPDILPVLIVIDTLSRSLAGGDENRDLPTAIGACDQLRDRLRATVLLVHHTGKDEDRGPRGHSSLFAAVDTSLCVKDNGGRRTAVIDKARDAVHGTALNFTLRPVNLGTDEDGEIVSTCIVEHKDDALDTARTRPGRALAAGAALVLTAIQKATADNGVHGSAVTDYGVPADVRAVALSHARDEHRRVYGDRDDDNKRGGRARQVAFSRGLDQLQAHGLVAASGQFVWQMRVR